MSTTELTELPHSKEELNAALDTAEQQFINGEYVSNEDVLRWIDTEIAKDQQVLSEYYFKNIEEKAAQISHNKGWSRQQLEYMANGHFRTAY